MKLIGMLDSPYVRRVAISLDLLGLPFEHSSLSVFSDYQEFQELNPQVKAPTLILDNGMQLMDSTLILDYAQTMSQSGHLLMSEDPDQRTGELHMLGIALAVADKTVQLTYERNLRPTGKQHGPWLERVSKQLEAGCVRLNMLCHERTMTLASESMSQCWLTTAVVWRCMEQLVPDQISVERYPALQQLSEEAEALPEFLRYPSAGPGVVAPN